MLVQILIATFCIHHVLGDVVLKFENPESYTVPANSTDTPLGFRSAVLPHPQFVDRPNTVIQLKELTNKYIKIWVETVDRGAAMCFKDNSTGPRGCDQGQITECYAPASDTLNIEFYCADSCQSSDVTYWYRVHTSAAGADDQWCANEPDQWPSDLRPSPSTFPSPKTTPETKTAPAGGGASTVLSSTVSIVLMMLICKILN